MLKKDTRQIQRTKNALKKAFFSLLQEKKDIKKISIIDITNKAEYNRATFYIHYSDKYSIFEEIMDDALEGFLNAYKEPFLEVPILDSSELAVHSVKIFNYIEENKKTFTLLFSNNSFSSFKENFWKSLSKFHLEELHYVKGAFEGIDKNLFVRYHTFSLMGMILYWIETDFEVSSKHMAEQVLKIYKNNSSRMIFNINKSLNLD